MDFKFVAFVSLLVVSAFASTVTAQETCEYCVCSYYQSLAKNARVLVSRARRDLNSAARLHRSVSNNLKVNYSPYLARVENEILSNDEKNYKCSVREERARARRDGWRGYENNECHGVIGNLLGGFGLSAKCRNIEKRSRALEASLQSQKRICSELQIYVERRRQVLEVRQNYIQELVNLRDENRLDSYSQFVGIAQDQVDNARATYDQAVAEAEEARSLARNACIG